MPCVLFAELQLPDGRRVALNRQHLSIGGPGSDIVLAKHGVLKDHATIRTERGRVMIEPAAGPVMVDGQRFGINTLI